MLFNRIKADIQKQVDALESEDKVGQAEYEKIVENSNDEKMINNKNLGGKQALLSMEEDSKMWISKCRDIMTARQSEHQSLTRAKAMLEAAGDKSQEKQDKDVRGSNKACARVRGAASDFAVWLAQPYNVDVELPDSDDEESASKKEELRAHAYIDDEGKEWCLCVAAHGQDYFTSASNWLDTFIVWVVGVFLLWIAPLIVGQGGLAAFQVWWLITACILMIFLTDLTFGIISVDIIGREAAWGTAPEETAAWYFQNGVIQASLTMSRFIFSDNAVDLIEELQEKQPYIWIYCFAFMAVAAYVILNLVTATICDKAQAIVNENEAERLFEMRMEEKKNMKDLRHIFEVLDEDGSGLVSTEEFDAAFEIQQCRDKFFLLGFEEEEMKQLFRVLDDDGQGELSVSELLKGMAQVQGDADSKSMLVASKTMDKVKVSYEKLIGTKGGTASMELGQTAREEPTLDDQLISLESYAIKRLDKLDDVIRSFHVQADSFEKKLQTMRNLPPLPATTSSSDTGKAKCIGDAGGVEASEVVIEGGDL
ncbi:Scn3a [Symbiodinium pilosum]|uniref:Scn3a protein n=1 Tax=Symbiodinium pilosum TaxID=2952 RepID=A0A812XFV7_SYMPI|nr:Scn3a [Symbiodinium pilosum]